MSFKIDEILVCPICKGKLHYQKNPSAWNCPIDHLSYPVKHEMPIMIVDQAISTQEEGSA